MKGTSSVLPNAERDGGDATVGAIMVEKLGDEIEHAFVPAKDVRGDKTIQWNERRVQWIGDGDKQTSAGHGFSESFKPAVGN